MNKLKEKGFKVKQKRSLFNKTGYKSYTLEQAKEKIIDRVKTFLK